MYFRKYYFIVLFSLFFFAFAPPAESKEKPWKKELRSLVKSAKAPEWMQQQIQEDLAPFTVGAGIKSKELDKLLKEQESLGNPLELIKISIRGGRVSVFSSTNNPRVSYVKDGLKRLAKISSLPDVDFLISMSDGIDNESIAKHLISSKKSGIKGRKKIAVPLFSFAKQKGAANGVVLIPDFEALVGSWGLEEGIAEANKNYPWDQKGESAVWRGPTKGDSNNVEDFLDTPRSTAVLFSLEYPELIDARFSSISKSESSEAIKEQYADFFGEFLPVTSHLEHKYQLLIDGKTSAFSRAYWQLFSNSLILKTDSDHVQWYYRELKPFTHYIPLDSDLENLLDMIDWAKENDAEAEKIANQATDFAKENLSYARVLQYMDLLIKEYAKHYRML
ncbi:MAG: hypothetical protein KR126chlam1_01196 [Chlamydiae bacterium]|nr:hypothetical protein [Chlamydiota bacterium]